ncbi:DUF2157 domain-containing protein [Inhella gelatinilytica]|uniref:DUF2157 domain-containing protein n=1 Tax=Inhella gelatinilytica TaxID=2795030 RepID=A0A931IYZ0_9BURK|nr:DUF2157 domain-containing protein [Inhella gelatinilytica]MBH9553575.1 DUF2157 domain-containing protein [Inhella gelatinilytica]
MHAADLRTGILQLAPDRDRREALLALAELDGRPPASLASWPQVLAPLAGLLFGLGLVMWVAANWGDWPRAGRFALLQATGVLAILGAWRLPQARTALGLVAFLLQGGLLAFFGQTYQTGADPWQLFALWAVLGLPLALALRSDWIWVPWTLVMALGAQLWVHTYSGHRWGLEASTLAVQVMASGVLLTLWLGLGPAARRWTGCGPWSERAGCLWLALHVGGWGLLALFSQDWALLYWVAGLVLVGAFALQWRAGDLVQLAILALAWDTWATFGLARALFDGAQGDPFGRLLLLGLIVTGLLAASVQWLMRRARAGVAA